MAAFRLSSPAFEHDGDLPAVHCGEDGISPALEWSDVPPETKELVLVCDDPDADAGVITHWVVYGITPDVAALPEGVPRDAYIDSPVELVQGLNEFDEVGYSGPEPDEEGVAHRIFFRLYALDTELAQLAPGVTRAELRSSAKGHVIATAELVAIA